MRAICNWNKEYESIYNKSKDYDELVARLKKLFEKWKKLGKLPKNFTWQNFFNDAQQYARRHEIIKSRHVKRAVWKKFSAKEAEAFKQAMKNGASREELMAKFKMLRNESDIVQAIRNISPGIRAERKKITEQKEVEVIRLPPRRKFSEPITIEISKDAWFNPDKRRRIGAMSRIDWKGRGARAALIERAFRIFAEEGCRYVVLNAGLVDKTEVNAKIKKILESYEHSERNKIREEVVHQVLNECAEELASVIPVLKKPEESIRATGSPFAHIYIITSLVLDGDFGEKIAQHLQELRPEVRIYKQGGDRTRIKGIGCNEEERKNGVSIGWLNPKRQRLPGQYASTSVDKEIEEEEAGANDFPDFWVVGGFGNSISKPGNGEKKIPRISLPALHVPTPRRPGEPSIALNQIGVRIIEWGEDGEDKIIRTWNLRDLVKDERSFITGNKDGATELQRKIVEAIKREPRGLHVGELTDIVGAERSAVQKSANDLLTPRSLKRVTWPGLFIDESGRFNLHRDWLQERLRYPWPYSSDVFELRRMIFGCLHAGYNTTDYEYICQKFADDILKRNATVLELVGDIIAGLKHNLVHRGEIIGNMNYTEQEIFAAELIGTVIMKVFKTRFTESLKKYDLSKTIAEAIIAAEVESNMPLFIYIIGNHDGWQKELGVTPGLLFNAALTQLLGFHIHKLLTDKLMPIHNLGEIIRKKIIGLPEHTPLYEFPGGMKTNLHHPQMARAKTTSIRSEEALGFHNDTQLVDIANFHTTIEVEKWSPDLGQRVVTQAGAMTPFTEFENGKMKRIDFGPVYVGIRYKDEKIFCVEHEFFSEHILKQPISKNTDIDELKKRLGVLLSPISKTR